MKNKYLKYISATFLAAASFRAQAVDELLVVQPKLIHPSYYTTVISEVAVYTDQGLRIINNLPSTGEQDLFAYGTGLVGAPGVDPETVPDLINPTAVAHGPDGFIYIADSATHSVMRFHAITRKYYDSPIPENNAYLYKPVRLKFGPNGLLYVLNGEIKPGDTQQRWINVFSINRSNPGAYTATFEHIGAKGANLTSPKDFLLITDPEETADNKLDILVTNNGNNSASSAFNRVVRFHSPGGNITTSPNSGLNINKLDSVVSRPHTISWSPYGGIAVSGSRDVGVPPYTNSYFAGLVYFNSNDSISYGNDASINSGMGGEGTVSIFNSSIDFGSAPLKQFLFTDDGALYVNGAAGYGIQWTDGNGTIFMDGEVTPYPNTNTFIEGSVPLDMIPSPVPKLDTDGDGLPNSFEGTYISRYNLANNPDITDLTPTGDLDGDGQANLQEYQARTDPLNASDRLYWGTPTQAGGIKTLAFTTKVGLAYKIQHCAASCTTWSTAVANFFAEVNGTTTLDFTSPSTKPQVRVLLLTDGLPKAPTP